jgi:nucleotide-binding universal stress UspA family protein
MKRILVATDGSSHGLKAIAAAAKLASAENAALTIINVMDDRSLSSELVHFGEDELAGAMQARSSVLPANVANLYAELMWPDAVNLIERQSLLLKEVVSENILVHSDDQARKAGAVEVQTLSKSGDPAAQILAAAESINADLIVLGRRGLGRIAELLLGSVSSKVLHHSRVNVLVVV